jgi:AcrR family transcriptional regulator
MGKKETAARRLAIIHTARDLFAEKDYYKTKISDITNRLGISHGTFYNYFNNKSDVFTHIIKGYIKRLEEIFLKDNPRLSNNAIEFRNQLVRLTNELFDVFIEDQNMYDLLFFRAEVAGLEIKKEIKKLFKTAELFIEKYLAHGVNKKFLRSSIDASLNAKAIRGMTMVALEDLMENDAPLQLKERWILSLSNFIIDGLS